MTSQISKNSREKNSANRSGKAASFTTKNCCPNCHSTDYRRTQRQGFLERLLALFRVYPFRCRNYLCNLRFFKFGRGQGSAG
jgi:hypothetical protein